MPKYNLGEPASAFYNRLASDRDSMLTLARVMAELTIPSLFPPESYKAGDMLPGNNQSLGARCVNNLAGTLMTMGFPPGQPMLKFEALEYRIREEINNDRELWNHILLALAEKEKAHRSRAVSIGLNAVYENALKQLLIAGNVLWQHEDIDEPLYHRMDTYVVLRDRRGNPIAAVLKEEDVVVETLDPDTREWVKRHPSYGGSSDAEDTKTGTGSPYDDTVTFYTCLRLIVEDGGTQRWEYWQECLGSMVPDTEVTTDFDKPPMYPHWLIPVYGSNWGLPYAEMYRGDHYAMDNLAKALRDSAAKASLDFLFVDPTGQTDAKELREAENLSVIAGRAQDVTSLENRKSGDYQFITNTADKTEQRLGIAYMLASGFQRKGERVTAEEWKQLGAELDRAMGGLYTDLAYRIQRQIVVRFVALHEEEDDQLSSLPKDVIRINVITGRDLAASTSEADLLVETVGTSAQLFPQEAQKGLSFKAFFERFAAAKGVTPTGLLKDEEQLAQEQQQAQQLALQQALMDKGIGPAAGALAKGAADQGLAQQPPQQQQE